MADQKAKRPKIVIELGALAGNGSKVTIGEVDVSNWITAVELNAVVGEVVKLKLSVLPEEVRLILNDCREVQFVSPKETGEGEDEVMPVLAEWVCESDGSPLR